MRYRYPHVPIRTYSGNEQNELAKKVASGDDSSRKFLIEASLRPVIVLADSIATSYQLPHHKFCDAVHEGVAALYLAMDKYDPDKGNWWAYASWRAFASVREFCASETEQICSGLVPEDPTVNGLEERETEDFKREIRSLVSELPSDEAEAVNLKYLSEPSLRPLEVVDRIGLTREGLRLRLRRALRTLRVKVPDIL